MSIERPTIRVTVFSIALAAILIYVINRAYFGWTIRLFCPWQSLVWELLLIMGVAVLASLYPALTASRTPATELSREDI